MRALAFLSKYLGIHDEFRALIRSYGLKWSNGNSDDLIIARLTKSRNREELFDWLSEVKDRIPLISVFADFIMATGLRFGEAVSAFNLIIELSARGRLGEYYDLERQVLEHYKFKEVFIRRSKKVFMSFVPRDLVERVAASERQLQPYDIQNWLKRAGLRLRFSDCREFYASNMTKHLSVPEVDFVQGRTTASVFMRNYFNPTWIADLGERAIRGEQEIIEMGRMRRARWSEADQKGELKLLQGMSVSPLKVAYR